MQTLTRVPWSLVTGAPSSPDSSSRRWQDLPSYRAVLCVRAMVEHPAECAVPSSTNGNLAAAFRRPVALGIRDSLSFRGCIPTAHTLAYLRIAHAVTDISARLTTDLPDFSFSRAGFAPAGRLIQISRSYRLLPSHWTGIARSHQA